MRFSVTNQEFDRFQQRWGVTKQKRDVRRDRLAHRNSRETYHDYCSNRDNIDADGTRYRNEFSIRRRRKFSHAKTPVRLWGKDIGDDCTTLKLQRLQWTVYQRNCLFDISMELE